MKTRSKHWGLDGRTLCAGLLLSISYYASTKIGLALRFPSNPLTMIWLPGGILLTVLLLTPVRQWWFYLAAVLPAHVTAFEILDLATWPLIWRIAFNFGVVILLWAAVRFGAPAIAERRKAEEELRLSEARDREVVESQTDLAHMQRLAAMGELTAMIAHEVNQPLGAILSNAEAAEMLLERDHPPLDEIRQILADIRQNDLRADETIRRIRALLRKRDMQMEALDLNETISDTLGLVASDAARRGVQIRKDFARKLPLASGDRASLQQVLLNLISNAMDAMKETPEPGRCLTIGTKHDGNGGLEIAVTDSGCGIAPDRAPHLFESFFTTKDEGMGLGLSIARTIITAHQGRIWADSNPAGGTTVHCLVRTAETSKRESGAAPFVMGNTANN